MLNFCIEFSNLIVIIMELDDDRYKMVCEQLKHCLLPELDRDIGNEQLVKEDFGIFRYGLEMNLQLLFDIVARKERILNEPFEGDNTFRVYFILLLHQQSGYDEAPFQTDNESVSKQIRFLTDKYYKKLISESDIRMECMKYYKERLTDAKWKRNIGAVYGFLQMIRLHQKHIQTKFNLDDCLFILSVGMHFVDYFETNYKKFGLVTFNFLLDYGNIVELQKINVYQVIFKKMINPLLQILTDEENTTLILSCIYKCIEALPGWKNPSKWNEIDDVLEDLMNRLQIESDNRCVAIIFLFILKLTTLGMKRPKLFSDLIDFEHLDKVNAISRKTNEKRRELFNELRNIFQSHHNLHIARWSRKLIEIYKIRDIFGKSDEIRFQLFVMHVVYICCFYGNPLFMGMRWQDFHHEFISQLMRFVANNIERELFIDEVYVFLDTIKLHLETADRSPEHFLDEHEQYVTKIIQSIIEIKPNLEAHCARKAKDDLENTEKRKTRFQEVTEADQEERDELNLDNIKLNPEEMEHLNQEIAKLKVDETK